MTRSHESTIVVHGARGDRWFARCNDCPWELAKPTSFIRARWLAGEHRNEAIRAERPWVRSTVDLVRCDRTVPAGTVGRELWRGEGCGELAGQLFVDVAFPGFGPVTCRPWELEASSPADAGLLFG